MSSRYRSVVVPLLSAALAVGCSGDSKEPGDGGDPRGGSEAGAGADARLGDSGCASCGADAGGGGAACVGCVCLGCDGGAGGSGGGVEDSGAGEAGSGGAPNGGDGGASRTDSGEPDDCFAAWHPPMAVVGANARPTPQDSAGLRFNFRYGLAPAGGAAIVLEQIDVDNVVRPADGPFMAGTHSGSWAELRDTNDVALYTQRAGALITEATEVPNPDGGLSTVKRCPQDGAIRLRGFPNLSEATDLVLFQEPIDGRMGGASVELARFRLP